MAKRDYGILVKATTTDDEIRDGTDLVRNDGYPQEWHEEDGVTVVLPSGKEILFHALLERGEGLFNWAGEGEPPRLAYLDRVDGRTMRVRLVQGVP